MFNSMYDLIQGRREADIFSQGNVDNRPRTLAEAIKEVLKIDYNGKTGSNIVGVGSETGIERRRGGTGDVERGGRGTEGERAADGKGRAKGDAGEEGVAPFSERLQNAIAETETEPTEAQKKAGNYKKGHLSFGGYDFTVETPKGAIRSGKDEQGKPWSVTMHDTYGYILGKIGVDGDHIDMFINDDADLDTFDGNVYVVDQVNPETGEFDEHKVMYGYPSEEAATEAYLANYSKGWKGLGKVTSVPKATFDKWLESSDRKTKPFREYVMVQRGLKQGKGKKKVEPGQQADYYSAFAEQYGLDAEDAKKETVANASAKAKEVKGLSNKLKDRYPTSLYLLERDISDMEEMVANGEVSPKRVERVRSEIKRLNGLLADYERLATPEERSWRDMKAEHPDEIVVVDNGNGLLVVCQEDVKATKNAIGLKLDAPVTENLIVTTNEEKGMPFTTMRVTLEDLQRLSDKGVKYVVLDKNGNQAKEEREKLRLQKADDYSAFAEQYGVDEADVRRYAEGMALGNLALANQAISEIRRSKRIEHRGTKLSEFAKLFAPLKNELYERFGDMDELQQEYVRRAEEERGMMEAARKRAEEEEAKRKQHLEELSLLTSEEIDRRYADAIDKGDDATAREMLDEAARRKGYDDTESAYQGVGAWAAPGNPGYESDKARRDDWESSGSDVNLEDMALGYTPQPDDYFSHPERYSQNTPHGLESTRAIQSALEALKRGEKDVKVKVYRAVPTSVKEGKLRNGDWVTPSKKYAEMHGNNRLEGKYRIIEDDVPVCELWWDGNDANEWGYDNGKGYKYKNVKNNRKLNDLITRDDNGNVILPSKRFNQRKADERYQRGVDGVKPSKAEVVLRDAVIDKLRESGIEVLGAEGQKVLDLANGRGVRLEAKRKRALGTASVSRDEKHQPTVVSSADGAKILNNLDTLATEYDNLKNFPKTFTGDVAKALGARRYGSSSEYATFETKNGKVVTIRLANHNARVSGFNHNGRDNGISIVISSKPNAGITNNGDAHIVEFYYNSIKLRRADGKPLAEIVRSIKQALYSGVFKDPTGLAERQEVNADDVISLQKVYHGSGADFDHFDHSHMGEGEGAQAYGWGTYVTEVEGIGRKYAERNPRFIEPSDYDRENANEEIAEKTLARFGHIDCEFELMYDGAGGFEIFDIPRDKNVLEQFKDYFKSHEEDFQSDNYIDDFDLNDEDDREQFAQDVERSMINYAENIAHDYDQYWKGIEQRILYTVEIPDDTGENYLDYKRKIAKIPSQKNEAICEQLRKALPSMASRIRLNPNATGAVLYKDISTALKSDKKASELLARAGFVGIKYPAQYRSGGRKDGAKNYVIFNEKDAKITDHVRFFKTKNGEAYGYTVGGKIYIDPRIANTETPIHEYAHLWASALRSGNPKEWENVVGLMKGTPVWEEVKKRYPELETDDEIADEVIATYSGRRGAERLRSEAGKIAGSMDELDAVKALSALQRVKEALKRFWKGVCDFLHIHFTSAEEVADRVMKDLLDGVDPRKFMKGKDGRPRFQFIGEKGATEADKAEEQTIRMDNLNVAKKMEEAKKDAKAIKMATGWERGADGKWRYEMPDAKIKDTIDVGGGNIVKRFEEDMLWTDGKLEDAVDAPKLFEAYPQLKNIKIHTDAVMNDMPSNGFYNPQTNTITIHADELKYLNSILNHEVQHAIQNIEGFAKGGNSETVRSRIQRIIDEEKDASEYAKSNLKQYAALHMLASRLKASKQFAKSDQQFFKDKAREYYWDAMNELDNNERSTLINEYPDDKNAQEIAESGYHVDEAIKELKRIADEYKDEIPKGNMDAFEKVNKLTSALENKSDDELYQALAGEVEARNVQKRMGMTPEERRNSLAEETEDVSRGDQIVMNNGGTSYSIVKDPETIKKLDKEDTVKVYRAMQVGEDGKLYPPMAAKVKGKFVQPIELGKWEQADERPELADDKGMFTLNKGNGKSLKAAYNPYLHTSRTPLNDQFSEAQNRPNIVTVEVEVPKSELTSGYKADKAKDAVGEVEWKAGIIQGQLTGKRKVILSRWDKPVRIVPDSEVADVIVNDMFKGKNITMPSNVVTPSLRKELEKRGVPFVETDNRGRIVGGENDGVHYAKVYGKKANVKHRLGEKGFDDGEREELDRVNERFNEELTRYQNGEMDKNEMLHLGRPQGVMRAFLPNLPIVMRQRVIKKGSEKKHEVDVSAIMNMPQHLSSPIFVFQRSEDTIGVLTDMRDRNGKNVCVAIELKRQIQQGAEYLEVNDVRSFHGREFKNIVEPIANNKTLKWVDKEKGLAYLSSASQPVQQEIDKQVLDTATKVVKDFVNPKVSDENVADDGIKLSLGDGGSREREQMDEAKMVEMVERVKATGESLGGAEAHVYTSFADVPEEYKKEVKKGARGWYDPETHTVHVYLPNCASGDEAQRTVFHEKIGHEGIEVLFGGEEGVKDFAKFVFSSCGKEVREKVMEIADQYDPEWKHPDRTNVGTQEYIAKLAENGPQTAEEFSLWRKIKHYLIKAMKKLGLTIRGLMNDKDLRYYLLRAQQSLHVWNKMPEAKKRKMAEQASETEMKESLSNRPRKRKNETTAQYIERLRQWEKWKIALDKASVANDPLPEEETYHDKWDKQYRTDMEAWRKANDIAEGAEGPSEAPKRAEGESPQEYALRVADHERELDLWQGAPDYFSYLKKAQEDYRKAYEAWKERYDIDEMENVDLQLYGGETPTEEPADEDAYQEQEEIEHNVNSEFEKEMGAACGIDMSAEGARQKAIIAVIDRRKNLEGASAEDAIFIGELCKEIDALEKELGLGKGELRNELIHIIEQPLQQQEADAELERWVDLLNSMRVFHDAHSKVTVEGVKAVRAELQELANVALKYGANPKDKSEREELHAASRKVADALNRYYQDVPGYHGLYGDDIIKIAKYAQRVAYAALLTQRSNELADNPKVRKIVEKIKDWYDEFFHLLEDAGLRGDAGYIGEGYVNHIWDKERSDQEAYERYVENYQRTKSSNMRHREIATYLDGIGVGLVPKFTDIGQIMSYYSRQNNEAIANRKFLDALSFLTIAHKNNDGEVTEVLPILNSHKPDRLDEEKYEMFHVPGIGDVWVLKEVAGKFSTIFGTMRTKDIPNWLSKLGKNYDLLASTMKKIQLSVSGFHALALSEVALAQMGPIKGMQAILKYILYDSARHGWQVPAYVHPEDFKMAAKHLVQKMRRTRPSPVCLRMMT